MYRPVYDAELQIIQPPGCGANFICEAVNEFLGLYVEGPLHKNNEFRSVPNHAVASLHLHEFFKLQENDGKEKVYTHTRYKQILNQLKDKQVVVILPEHWAGLVDCLALYKMYNRTGTEKTLNYVRSRARLDFALEPGHEKQNKHYSKFVDYLKKYEVNHLVLTYDEFILNNTVDKFHKFIDVDIGLDFTDYNNSKFQLIREMRHE